LEIIKSRMDKIKVNSGVESLQKWNPFDYFVEIYAEEFPFTYDQMLQQELTAYLNLSVPIHGVQN
jgi:hypothetical protein